MVRRNLSKVFIFDKFEGEESRTPTCFEDCREATQDEWLSSLSRGELVTLSKKLGNTLKEIGEGFNLKA